ncbi:NAD(+) kinase [Hornefia porci]|uniref:NAD kinase n=1 Tax=Hornefia porci TaxID=2652292 RepID=A0A1Q9JFC6_9FIRM|nr:NAD(+)/NADH kinase [Hornefia porci]OLR54811.1 NAD(+) kinase [Hornefia porci]
MNKKIFVFSNQTPSSLAAGRALCGKLDNSGYTVTRTYSEDAELMVCIGGDGTFLEAIHKYHFPTIPIIGINTGHLGFFQEIMPDQLDDFIFNYSQGNYTLQPLSTVRLRITCGDQTYEHIGLNEVSIKGINSYNVHLNLSIGGSFIERFSGDGLVVATPAGSTAYNYSLGGSIVDPRLNLLQITPIAPMNTTAYRAFTSSILLPSDLSLGLIPDMSSDTAIAICRDGYTTEYSDVREMTVDYSDIKVNLIRFEGYDFWTKVKSKFL